jgi:hypothetical protein
MEDPSTDLCSTIIVAGACLNLGYLHLSVRVSCSAGVIGSRRIRKIALGVSVAGVIAIWAWAFLPSGQIAAVLANPDIDAGVHVLRAASGCCGDRDVVTR